MRAFALLCSASVTLAALAALASCNRQEPLPPPPPPPPSAWLPADSHQISDDLIAEALKHPWITDFKTKTGQSPQVRVGLITDRSQGQVDLIVLNDQLERALAASSQAKVAAAGFSGDFVLQGSVSEQDGQKDGHAVKFYDVDLTLVDAKGVPVCTLQKEVAKNVEAAPAPVNSPAGQ